MKDLGIVHLEIDGSGVLGFDTGLNAQAFAQAKMAQVITQPGYIVSPGVCRASCAEPPKIADQAIFYLTNSENRPDNRDFCVTDGAKIHKYDRLPGGPAERAVVPWRPGGVIEREGTMVIWGPDFDGERLDRIVSDGTRKEAALDALRYWITARLLLEGQEDPPFPWPAGALVAVSGAILFPPERILRRVLDAAGDDLWLTGAACWVHPDLTGREAAAYGAATMAYRIFCGTVAFQNPDIDLVRQDMREAFFIPPRLLAPGLEGDLARILEETLAPVKYFSQKGTKRPGPESLGALLGTPGSRGSASYIRELTGEEQAKLSGELERFKKKKGRTVKTKRFLLRNTAIITGGLVALVVLVLSVGSILSGRAALPTTRGMSPRQVVEAYYGALETLDHSLMEACVTGKAGKDDIAMVSNLFVMSRVRMAYEMNNPVISARQWLDAGGLPTEQTVVGITGMEITELDANGVDGEVSFRVSYTLWLPGSPAEMPESTETAPEEFNALPQGIFHRDELRLSLVNGLWRITDIRRETPTGSG
ncbi:MAG: hypothetical protein LBT93_06260 [Treponema sp.]|nr:hypothetical protein [Treponema sp.]